MTVGELTYFILDSCKIISDDSIINENHVMFLMKKYRNFLIKKEQEKERSTTDEASMFESQQICLDLEKVPALEDDDCSGYYLRTVQKIPKTLEGNQPRIYPIDFYQGINIAFVPRDRMRYIGTNRFLENIIYVSLAPDLHLYLNSSNPQFLYLKRLRMAAVFEDYEEAAKLLCNNDGDSASCNVFDITFPIRDNLVPQLIELCIKDITGFSYKPKDPMNNAKDDLADLASFIRSNTKNGLQQQIEG